MMLLFQHILWGRTVAERSTCFGDSWRQPKIPHNSRRRYQVLVLYCILDSRKWCCTQYCTLYSPWKLHQWSFRRGSCKMELTVWTARG